ncbi:serpin family protein [Endozoicomonas sp. 8E]|uniref:serpin family protein n=1 Tax=Endozoicomonas sp. 8E TaxID=3035692 RepID=UPI002938E1B4|nr:serpin family protein [Endozoicomonas sp. 8E]WOG25607.1 serpin family protein [Endozoicomonas sp. 8E]
MAQLIKSPDMALQHRHILLSVSLLYFLLLPSQLRAVTYVDCINDDPEKFPPCPALHEEGSDSEPQGETRPFQSATPENPDSDPRPQAAESRGNLELAISVFSQAAKVTPENFLISPDGLYRALGLILMGATGETRRLLQSYLGDNYSEPSLAAAPIATSSAQDEYSISNTMLLSSELEVKETYRERLKQVNIDFRDNINFFDRVSLESLADELNRLFSQLTHGMIPQFCYADQWSPATTMALINSIYFKGLWERSFNVRKAGKFTLRDGQRVNLNEFMVGEISFSQYTNHNDWQAVTVPYRGAHEMILVLPPKGIMPHEISAEIIMALFSSLNSGESCPSCLKIAIGLPPFKVDSDIELSHFLRKTALHPLFTSPLELGAMLSDPLAVSINMVHQHCAIEVNENGTRAAAVTHIALSRSADGSKSIQFNRPFIYVLHNKITKRILFIGQTLDPRSTSESGTGSH